MSRHGATQSNWQTFNRTTARGHAKTPERPSDVFKHPEKYQTYIKKHRKPTGGPPVRSQAQQVIAKKERLFSDRIKYNDRNSAKAVFRNPVTKRPPDPERLAEFLRMKAAEIENLDWSKNEWAFLYYH